MGCCGSSEANAAETELPIPEWGKPFKCRLKKKGMFDADYTVYSEDDQKWMLIDAVGSMWDDGYTYFLKHRAPGQVDAEGNATSTTLGAVNIKGDWDAFSFKVSGAGRDVDIGPFYDVWDGDFDWGMTSEKCIWAVWTFSKRAVLYSDYEMTNQIGWLDITGSGTWYQEKEERLIHDTDDDGEQTTRWETEWHSECRPQGFQYKFNVFNTPMAIAYDRRGGGLFKAATLTFRASNAFAPDVPLFVAQGDGEKNCTIEAFPNCDPVSTLLAAYAISCRLDPNEFGEAAEKMCERHISLGMPPGMSEFHGMTPEDFERNFTKYPAPVPQVFAQQVAAHVPAVTPNQVVMFGLAQPAGMQGVAQPAPMQGVAQPAGMMQPGVAMAQQPGVAVAQPMPTSHMLSVQVPQGMQGGMPMQVQTPSGVMQVQIPPGLQPGMTFQMQVPGPGPMMTQPAMAVAQPM